MVSFQSGAEAGKTLHSLAFSAPQELLVSDTI